MLDCVYLPHFSIVIGEIADLAQVERQLAQYAQETAPFMTNLAYLGVFPTNPGVVFLGLTMTPKLIAYHQAFHQQFAPYFASRWDYYLPENWVAHCTIAFKLSPPTVPQVVAIAQEYAPTIFNRPIQVQKIGIVRVPGSIECCTFYLQG